MDLILPVYILQYMYVCYACRLVWQTNPVEKIPRIYIMSETLGKMTAPPGNWPGAPFTNMDQL